VKSEQSRNDRRWLWGVLCFSSVVFCIVWRWQTFHLSDFTRASFGHLQYSDTVVFYYARNLPAHQLPYVQQQFEYPVLTGLAIWLSAWAPDISGYFLATSALLLACFLGCFVLLTRLGPATRLSRYAAAPGLALYGVLNWDALGLIGLVAGIYFAHRRRFGWAGIVLALGASAKLFPAFILPVLLVSALRASDLPDPRAEMLSDRERLIERAKPATRLLASFVAVTLALNVPIALLNYDGWSHFWTFQSTRGINPDSIWFHLPRASDHVVSVWFVELVLFVVTVTCIEVWLNRGAGWEAGCLLCLLAFLLFSRDYSPQYDLWLLPLLAILACPLWLWLVFVVLDAAYYASIFWYYFLSFGGHLFFPVPDPGIMLGITVWGREAALTMLLAWAFIRLRTASESEQSALWAL
jgi:uncharacterized membrane protein